MSYKFTSSRSASAPRARTSATSDITLPKRVQEKTHYIASTTFVLNPKYSDLKVLGKGSYGVVVSASSTQFNKKVAIKKIKPVAKQHVIDAKHVLREIRLMRHMGKHENVINLLDISYRESADEIYIVMDMMDSDLHRIIQSPQNLSELHYQHFMYQLLSGLKYLHDNRIIHRDLKPANLLVSKDCRLKISDFGLARKRPNKKNEIVDDEEAPMTEHVVTRWYRSPELMLCPDGLYDYSVDIWSCGCILGEMLGRAPMFPGKNFVHQLSLVFDVIGAPRPSEVSHIINLEAKKFLQQQSNKKKVPFSNLYPNFSPQSWDILDCFLIFNPEKRITVDQALRHPFFSKCSIPESDIYPPVDTQIFNFDFDRENFTKNQIKDMIIDEINSFQSEHFGKKRISLKPPVNPSLVNSNSSASNTKFSSKSININNIEKDEVENKTTKTYQSYMRPIGNIRSQIPSSHKDNSEPSEKKTVIASSDYKNIENNDTKGYISTLNNIRQANIDRLMGKIKSEEEDDIAPSKNKISDAPSSKDIDYKAEYRKSINLEEVRETIKNATATIPVPQSAPAPAPTPTPTILSSSVRYENNSDDEDLSPISRPLPKMLSHTISSPSKNTKNFIEKISNTEARIPESPAKKSILETYTTPHNVNMKDFTNKLFSTENSSPNQEIISNFSPPSSPKVFKPRNSPARLQESVSSTTAVHAAPTEISFKAPKTPEKKINMHSDKSTLSNNSILNATTKILEANLISEEEKNDHVKKVTDKITNSSSKKDLFPRKNDQIPSNNATAPAPAPAKKKITIAKSPKFSIMSWQRKIEEKDNDKDKEKEKKTIPRAKSVGKMRF